MLFMPQYPPHTQASIKITTYSGRSIHQPIKRTIGDSVVELGFIVVAQAAWA